MVLQVFNMLSQFRGKTPQEINLILDTYSLKNLTLLNHRIGTEIESIERRLDETNEQIVTLQQKIQSLTLRLSALLETETEIQEREQRRISGLESYVGDASADVYMARNTLMQYSPMDQYN